MLLPVLHSLTDWNHGIRQMSSPLSAFLHTHNRQMSSLLATNPNKTAGFKHPTDEFPDNRQMSSLLAAGTSKTADFTHPTNGFPAIATYPTDEFPLAGAIRQMSSLLR